MTRLIAASAVVILATTLEVLAQDELIGTWEAVIGPEVGVEVSGRITLDADNTVEYAVEVEIGPEFFFGAIGDVELPDIPFFTEGFAMRLVLHGSWASEDGVLTLHMAEYELTINDVTIEDFFLVLAREFAAVIAEEQEIADEERADFEESFVDGFMLDLDADVFEEGLVESFREDAAQEYEVDDNTMFWFEDGEVATEFRRLTPSVVSEWTWGQVKAATPR